VTAFAACRRLAGAFLATTLLAACGSGAVSNQVVDPNRITVLPGTATVYSGMPTTFSLSGGTGQYILSSSDQAVIQTSADITSAHSVELIANPVLTDRVVTLTVRDTGSTTAATATITVKPNPVANNITITPSSTQGGSCAPAICSGGDALITATISTGGIPLAGHLVRLEALSGDFRFIISPPGSVEVLSTVTDVTSDQVGKVQARIRVLSTAPNQTALLQVTDLDSAASQRASFAIAQSTGGSPGFFVTPDELTFVGPNELQCAGNGARATVFIFGGVPPYSVFNSGLNTFNVSLFDPLDHSGAGFDVISRGVCVDPGIPITVSDSAGHTASITVANVRGTDTLPPQAVAPTAVTIASCTQVASVSAAGGTGNYFVGSGSDLLTVTVSGRAVSISRRPGTTAIIDPTTLTVGVSDGREAVDVEVTLTGAAAGAC
jgi:hypothetical protein